MDRKILQFHLLLFTCFVISKLHDVEVKADDLKSFSKQQYEFSNFKTTEPLNLKPVENIEVRIGSNKKGILVSFEIDDYLKNNSSHLSSRDDDILDNYVEIIFDFTGDGNNAYGFRVSENGSVNDYTLNSEAEENRDWDGVWEYEVEVKGSVWIVTMFIPWSTTLFEEPDEQNIELNFYTAVWQQAQRTKSSYPAIKKTSTKFINKFSTISLEYSKSDELTITPYLTFDNELKSKSSEQRAGLTVTWKGGSQALSYAYLPDFGQVESNDLVLNLSAIETFFSEKRRFFLDEAELYQIEGPENLSIFHSPRIGSFTGPNENSLNIEHAIKYSSIFNNFEIGLIASQEESASNLSGRNFQIVRGRYNYNNSNVGYLITKSKSPSENKRSHVNTIDFNVELDDELKLFGFYSQSNIKDEFSTKVSDSAKFVALGWNWSDDWSNELKVIDYGEFFDINDSGFVARIDRKQLELETEFEISEYDSSNFIASSVHGFEFQHINNHDNKHLGKQFATENQWILSGKQIITFEAEYLIDIIDDKFTRGNNSVSLPDSHIIEFDFESAPLSGWSYSLDIKTGEEGLSGKFLGLGANLTLSLSDELSLSLGIDRSEYDSYLIWDDENRIIDHSATETEFEFSLNTRFGLKHSIDIKLESVALKARALQNYEAQQNGSMVKVSDDLKDVSIGELAISYRYHYQPNKNLNFYLVYSRGGENERDNISLSSHNLIRKAYSKADISRIFAKIEYSF